MKKIIPTLFLTISFITLTARGEKANAVTLPNTNAGTPAFSSIGNYKVLAFQSRVGNNSVDVKLPAGAKVVAAFMGYESEYAATKAGNGQALTAGQALTLQAPDDSNYSYANATQLLNGDPDSSTNNASANQFADITNAVQTAGSGTYTNTSANAGNPLSSCFIYVILQSNTYPLEDVVLTDFAANDVSSTGLVTGDIPITLTKPFLPNAGAKGSIMTFMGTFDANDNLNFSYNSGENLVATQTPAALSNTFVKASYTLQDANPNLNFHLALQNGGVTTSGENISTMLVQVPVSPNFVTYTIEDQDGNFIPKTSGLVLSNQNWTNPDGTTVAPKIDDT